MTRRHIAALAALMLPARLVWADIAHPAAPPPAPAVSLGSLFQVGLALALVLGTVFAVAWLLKRISPGQPHLGGALRVVSATAVGQRERVVLVEVNDTWLVVGVASGHVTALHSMPRPASPPVQPAAAAGDNKFAGWLKQTLERGRNG